MNIYRFELKKYARSLWLWGLSYASLQLIFMVFFPGISRDAELVDQILQLYPEEILKALGMAEITSLATVLGYYTMVFVFVQLCLAVESAYYGFNLLSVEEREKTADFLFTKPASRNRILAAKYLAALTALFTSSLVVTTSAIVSVELFRAGKTYDWQALIALLLSVPLFQLLFFSTGMLVTTLTAKVRSVIGHAMSLAFGLYIINTVRAIIGGELLGLVSPFYHYRPAFVLQEGYLPLWVILGSVKVIVLFTLAGVILYNRRNIQAL